MNKSQIRTDRKHKHYGGTHAGLLVGTAHGLYTGRFPTTIIFSLQSTLPLLPEHTSISVRRKEDQKTTEANDD